MTYLLEEHPRPIAPDDPVGKLGTRIVEWICNKQRAQGTWVAGVWGGRGTGKTSLLLTILCQLREQPLTLARELVVLPSSPQKRRDSQNDNNVNVDERALFAPARSRTSDAVLFLLLDYLETRYAKNQADKFRSALDRIRHDESRRYAPERFLDYEKEIATSSEDIPERTAKLLSEIAKATRNTRENFDTLLTCLQGQGESQKRLLVLIDDIDVQPHRSLELLETIDLFLRRDGVIVLIAADRELMLEGLSRALARRGIRQTGLPGALLAKLVPYGWSLPRPNEKERFNEVWRTRLLPKWRQLPKWWSKEACLVLRDEATGAEPRDVAAAWLKRSLPSTYRGLVAYHNQLSLWYHRLTAEFSAHERDQALAHVVNERLSAFELHESLAPPFFSTLIALDVKYPELRLLDEAWNDPELAQTAMGRTAGDLDFLENDPWFAKLLASLGPPGERSPVRLDAIADLRRLVEFLVELRKRQEQHPIPRWFVAVSLNADALEWSRQEWEHVFTEDEVRQGHLDLRKFASPTTPSVVSPTQLRKAYNEAIRLVDQQGLRSFRGIVELFTRAKASLLLRLGHELRFLDRVVALNFYQSTYRRFSSPSHSITYGDRGGSFDLLLCDPPLTERGTAIESDTAEAIVLLDLLGKSSPEQLERFYDRDENPVRAAEAYCLRMLPGTEVVPEQLEIVLGDVVELFGYLLRYRKVRKVHFGYAGPDVVAFLLGQQLHALGFTLALYEFFSEDGGRYRYVFDLEEST